MKILLFLGVPILRHFTVISFPTWSLVCDLGLTYFCVVFFQAFQQLFQSHHADGKVIKKGCVQRNHI